MIELFPRKAQDKLRLSHTYASRTKMISAHEYKILDVLGDKFVHEIPPYQRPYAWGSDETLQLLDDLIEAATAQAGEPYFLGSIVRIRAPEETIGQVVDGQQRLTTLTILAAALRDLADDPQERDAIAAAVYINPNPFKNQREAVRVLAHTEDRVFFREAIQLPGSTGKSSPPEAKTEAQKLMWSNAQALRGRILELHIVERQQIVTFLLNQCVLVIVETDSRDSALRIFRVLNDRGLDLSNSDVIKADLLAKFNQQAELVHQAARWRALETDLGRDDFESLLENIRFIWEKGKNRRTLSDAYSERFRTADAVSVRRFFDNELAPAKLWFATLIDGDCSELPPEIRPTANEALAGLRLVQNKDWMSAALAASLKYESSQKLVDAWEALERLAWVLQLGRRYDTQRMNRYAEFIRALNSTEDDPLLVLRPTSDEASDAKQALNGPLYDRFPTRVVRAILERLDRLMAEQPAFHARRRCRLGRLLPTWRGAGSLGDVSARRTI
jgi:hypothetical protein